MTNTNNSVQERTSGTCITAFRSGNAIAAIMCRLSKRGKPYLAWYPLTSYRYKPTDNEQISRFIFAEHGKDMSVVTDLATEFLEKWKYNVLEAIEHVKAEEAEKGDHTQVEKWLQELTEEREALVAQLNKVRDSVPHTRMNAVVHNISTP